MSRTLKRMTRTRAGCQVQQELKMSGSPSCNFFQPLKKNDHRDPSDVNRVFRLEGPSGRVQGCPFLGESFISGHSNHATTLTGNPPEMRFRGYNLKITQFPHHRIRDASGGARERHFLPGAGKQDNSKRG